MSCIIIITGSSGFIGKRMVQKIINNTKLILKSTTYSIPNNTNYKSVNTHNPTIYILGIDILGDKINNTNYTHIQTDLSKEINNVSIIKQINELKKIEDINSNNIYVLHLAAKISVEESMKNPIMYYNNNFMSTLNILEIMRKSGINNIFFSSTAAVYDSTDNKSSGVTSESEILPNNVYGYTKYMAEELIKSYIELYNINAIIFRFFNVAGGKDTAKPHHLIPVLIQNIIDKKPWKVFGKNYKTKDGTCVRDYVHVDDISDAFILGICNLNTICISNIINNKKCTILNLGSKTGYTILDIMEKVKKILIASYPSIQIPQTLFCENRDGDPDILIADISEAYDILGWKPKLTIKNIIIDTMVEYNLEKLNK